MVRDATFSDVPALSKLLERAYRKSKYADRTGLHTKSVEQLFLGLVSGQRQNGPQASYLRVATKQDKVVGFLAGTLGRVYNVGEKLVASDVFFISEGSYPKDLEALIDGYVEWASANPKVIEIGLSWSDAVRDGAALAKLYKRKGFTLVGEQYELRTDVAMEKAA